MDAFLSFTLKQKLTSDACLLVGLIIYLQSSVISYELGLLFSFRIMSLLMWLHPFNTVPWQIMHLMLSTSFPIPRDKSKLMFLTVLIRPLILISLLH